MPRASVISPYQKFYGLDGITPLSNGTVTFYENLTTTLLSIYADRDLTIPQENPYTLDAGGAINGDVFFGTTATLETRSYNAMEVVTFDYVTCFDQGVPFSLWDPAETYSADYAASNIVQSPVDDNYYISIQANNLNHEPSVSPLWWQPFGDFLLLKQTVVPPDYVAIGSASTGLTGINMSVKGSLLTGDGAGPPIVFPVGADGLALKADSSTPSGFAWGSAAAVSMTRIPRSSDTIITALDSTAFFDVTGTFTQTFETPANLTAGFFCYYRNSGTGDITIPASDGLTNWITYPGEVRVFQSDGTTLRSFILNGFSKTFTSSGTFVSPPGYTMFSGLMWGGGGGGVAVYGGGGGACVPFTLAASLFGASETYTQGAGGSTGSAGGNSTLGSIVTAYGGQPGSAGSTGGYGGGALSNGGRPSNSAPGTDNAGFGGGAGDDGTETGGWSAYGGGGGTSNAKAGGNSLYGGGGGGGTGGNSIYGGDGGGNNVSGTAPGGAGGSGVTSGGSGRLTIWGAA